VSEFKQRHFPVGAYLPVGQLEGDCACGNGAYPCPDTTRRACPAQSRGLCAEPYCNGTVPVPDSPEDGPR
jgi:hypothetical protein